MPLAPQTGWEGRRQSGEPEDLPAMEAHIPVVKGLHNLSADKIRYPLTCFYKRIRVFYY